jgi:hypothetical protein
MLLAARPCLTPKFAITIVTWVPSCPERFQYLKGVKRKSRWWYDDHHLKRASEWNGRSIRGRKKS